MESLQHSSVSNTGALLRGKEEMELVHLVALSWNTEPKMLAAEGSHVLSLQWNREQKVLAKDVCFAAYIRGWMALPLLCKSELFPLLKQMLMWWGMGSLQPLTQLEERVDVTIPLPYVYKYWFSLTATFQIIDMYAKHLLCSINTDNNDSTNSQLCRHQQSISGPQTTQEPRVVVQFSFPAYPISSLSLPLSFQEILGCNARHIIIALLPIRYRQMCTPSSAEYHSGKVSQQINI